MAIRSCLIEVTLPRKVARWKGCRRSDLSGIAKQAGERIDKFLIVVNGMAGAVGSPTVRPIQDVVFCPPFPIT